MAGCTNEELSIVLSRILDSYGLDDDNRIRRVECQRMAQLILSQDAECFFGSFLGSGSSFEATTIDGLSSDRDVMISLHCFRVIDNIEQWKKSENVWE